MEAQTHNERIFATIIAGLDFSPSSQIVAEQARQLAKEFNARLVFVHSEEEPVQLEHPSFEGPESLEALEKELLEETKSDLAEFYRIQETEDIIVQMGETPGLLNETAKSQRSPLIVIGSSQHGAVAHAVLGSNAELTALHARCPVWIHRSSEKAVHFERILVPIDASKSTGREIELLNQWASKKPIKVCFLYVSPETPTVVRRPEFEEALSKLANATFSSFEVITEHGDPAEKICELGRDFDLVAMHPHNRSGVWGTFGKVTKTVMHRSPVPVLVLQW